MSANPLDPQKWWFLFAEQLSVLRRLSLQKTMFLIVLPEVHGQSRGGLRPVKPFESLGFYACVPAVNTGTQ